MNNHFDEDAPVEQRKKAVLLNPNEQEISIGILCKMNKTQ